jgi:predicted Rossmann fold nucleotide-binding protein DprA/Smf involved in DNA uptake
LLDPNFSGSNKLIEDGATVVTKPEVLIEGYAEQFDTLDMSKIKSIRDLMYENKGKNANVAKSEKQLAFDQIVSDRRQRVQKQNDSLALVGDEKLAYEALSEAFENIDVITDKCDLPLNRLATALTMLELKGLAESASGKRYKLS